MFEICPVHAAIIAISWRTAAIYLSIAAKADKKLPKL